MPIDKRPTALIFDVPEEVAGLLEQQAAWSYLMHRRMIFYRVY